MGVPGPPRGRVSLDRVCPVDSLVDDRDRVRTMESPRRRRPLPPVNRQRCACRRVRAFLSVVGARFVKDCFPLPSSGRPLPSLSRRRRLRRRDRCPRVAVERQDQLGLGVQGASFVARLNAPRCSSVIRATARSPEYDRAIISRSFVRCPARTRVWDPIVLPASRASPVDWTAGCSTQGEAGEPRSDKETRPTGMMRR